MITGADLQVDHQQVIAELLMLSRLLTVVATRFLPRSINPNIFRDSEDTARCRVSPMDQRQRIYFLK